MKKIAALIVVAFIAAGCAVKTPAQAVFSAHASYEAALEIAVTYKRLPACEQPGAPVLCSDREIVSTIQRADDLAFEALSAAQRTVRDPAASKSKLDFAVVAAQEGVGAFREIVSKIRVK